MPDPLFRPAHEENQNSYSQRGLQRLDSSLQKIVETHGFLVQRNPSDALIMVSLRDLVGINHDAAISLLRNNFEIGATRFSHREMERLATWENYLEDPERDWDSFSLVHDGYLVGGRNISFFDTPSLGRIVFGENLYVSKAAQGLNHGSSLVLGLEPLIIQRGARVAFSEAIDVKLLTPNEALDDAGETLARDSFWRKLGYSVIDGYYAQPGVKDEYPLLHLKLGAKSLDPAVEIGSILGPVLIEALRGYHSSFVGNIETDPVHATLKDHYLARANVGTVEMGTARNHAQDRAELERRVVEHRLKREGFDLSAELIAAGNVRDAMEVIEDSYQSTEDRIAAKITFERWIAGQRSYKSPYQGEDLTLRHYSVFHRDNKPTGVASLYEVTGQRGVAHIGWFGVAGALQGEGAAVETTKALIKYCEEAARLQGAGEIRVFYPEAELLQGFSRVHTDVGYKPLGEFVRGGEREVLLGKKLGRA